MSRQLSNQTDNLDSTARRFINHGVTAWNASQAVIACCTALDVYIIVCLSLYWWRESRPVRQPRNTTLNDSNFGSTLSRLATNSRWQISADHRPLQRVNSRYRNRRERAYRFWMFLLGVSAAAFALIKFAVDQVKFFYAWNARSNVTCEVINDVTEVGLYGATMVCVYGFLWLRQWMFYHNPSVKHLLYRKHVIRFSRYLPIVIMGLLTILVIFHLTPVKYLADNLTGEKYLGCVGIYDVKVPSQAFPVFLYLALTLTFQTSLLFLFLYPLLRRYLDVQRKRNYPTVSSSPNSHRGRAVDGSELDVVLSDVGCGLSLSVPALSPANSRVDCLDSGKQNCERVYSDPRHPKKKIKRLKQHLFQQITINNLNGIKASKNSMCMTSVNKRDARKCISSRMQRSATRAVIWTSMCIVTDIVMVGFTLSFGPGVPLVLVTAMNDFNIVLNQFCLIATYSKWREILFPIPNRNRGTSDCRPPHSAETTRRARDGFQSTSLGCEAPAEMPSTDVCCSPKLPGFAHYQTHGKIIWVIKDIDRPVSAPNSPARFKKKPMIKRKTSL